MIMKKNSSENMRKNERKLCLITLMMKKRTFKNKEKERKSKIT